LPLPRPPHPPLVPYTTLFRSARRTAAAATKAVAVGGLLVTRRRRSWRLQRWAAASTWGRCSRAHSIRAPWLRPAPRSTRTTRARSEEHTSELQSRENLVCRLL